MAKKKVMQITLVKGEPIRTDGIITFTTKSLICPVYNLKRVKEQIPLDNVLNISIVEVEEEE